MINGIPTGHGKTLIIAALAQAIVIDDDEAHVIIVVMNDILSLYASHYYATPNWGQIYETHKRIHIMTLNEFSDSIKNESGELLGKTTVILDEVDNLTQNKPFMTSRLRIGDKSLADTNIYLAQYKPFLCNELKHVIGFTGTCKAESTIADLF